ncbi:MAG TPA: protein kinase [Bryobacteraceae bacterium]|nr:protein kinase [Bryobacteraceae bacterium]
MQKIGKYEITGELGTGGFGKVYKALDPTVGRVVAVKVLNVQDDPTQVKRFRAEATTSARLQHKNIVTVHEFGEDRGKHFLVMEYLDGQNLHRLIREPNQLPTLQKLQIMSEVAQGLHYAHIHDVVHRDVKPANIMWLSDGSVKVMDFGIARLMHSASTRLTRTGSMIGTMQYMAPEQFTSDSPDARCDIWAYGVVLYEFLTGTNPFDAANALQVMYLVTQGDHSSLMSFPDRPAGLAALMRRLLAKSPDDRYATMEDAQFDLDQVIAELKKTQVGSLEHGAGKMIQEGRLSEALSVVRQILELDQSHETARRWRRDLTDRIRTQSQQVRIQELADQAEARAAERDYTAAAEHLDAALRIDPNNTAVRARLEEIRSEAERVRRAASLVAEARIALQQQALTTAFEHASQAAQEDPRNAEAVAFFDQVKSMVERRELETRRKGALSKAKGLILVQDYASAARVLEEWSQQHPGDPEVQEKLDQAKRLQATFETQTKVEAAIVEAKEMIRRGSFRRALEILKGLDQQIPEVAGLVTYARDQLAAEAKASRNRDQERQTILRLVGDCRGLLLAGNLDQAATRSNDLSKQYPNDQLVAELREEVARKIQDWREQRRRTAESLIEQGRANAVREAIAEIEGLIGRGMHLPALAAANAALERFPKDAKIAQLRQEAQTALDRRPTSQIRTPDAPPKPVAAAPIPGVPARVDPPQKTSVSSRTLLLIAAVVLVVALVVAYFAFGAPSAAHEPGSQTNPAEGAAKTASAPVPPPRSPGQTEPKAVKTKTPADPAPSKPTVPSEGSLAWTGDLDANQELDLGSNSGVTGTLPGVPITITEVHPTTVQVVSPPGPQNQWRHLVVRNDGSRKSYILVKWALAKK